MSGQPALSVIVAVQEGGASPEACVQSLLTQLVSSPDVEILVIDGTAAGWSVPAALAGRIELLRAPEAGSLPRLLGRGLEASRGRLVAFTEAHVTFEPGWLERALAVEAREHVAAVGGAVRPGTALGMLDRAVFLCDYATFLEPARQGETKELPGCNVVFQRGALAAVEEPSRRGFWKTFHCDALRDGGERLELDPGLLCRHHLNKSLGGWVRKRLVHGRCFGGMRRERCSKRYRLLYALTAPLVPFLLFGRLVRTVWPKGDYRSRLVTHAPLCFLAIVLWVVGEWVGNLFGSGQSCGEV